MFLHNIIIKKATNINFFLPAGGRQILAALPQVFFFDPYRGQRKKQNKFSRYFSSGSVNPFEPVVIYDNADQDKIHILNDNRKKVGIYR